jgi:hypothetical protein
MRMHSWLAALSSLLLLLAPGPGSAQSIGPSSADDPFVGIEEGRVHLSSTTNVAEEVADVRAQSPMGFAPPSANNNPAALWPPNTPMSYHPYPQISPYYQPNVARDTTYFDGVWFREILHRQRDYFFTAEYLVTRFRDPGNAYVGANPIPLRAWDRSPAGVFIDNYGLGGPANFGPTPIDTEQRVLVGPGAIPYPAVFLTSGAATRTFLFEEAISPVRRLDVFDSPLKTDGLRLRWGFTNEDESGMMLSGWWGIAAQERFLMGTDNWNGIPITQDLILDNTPTGGFAPIFPRNGALTVDLAPGFAIGIAGGQGTGTSFGFTGIAQKFDVLYQLDVETTAGGASLNVYHEPLFNSRWVRVRPTLGARYLYVDERFFFRGIDSGLNYTVDAPTFGGAGAGGGAAQVFTFRPTGATVHIPIVNNIAVPLFFEASLTSQVDSHLAGPETGIRYDFGGGKHFGIWGQSTFALLANHERVKIHGRNIGEALNHLLVTGENFTNSTRFDPVTNAFVPDPSIDTRFEDIETHTHASPMFEQSIFAEADVLKFVPIINKCEWFEDAKFRVGYTYTVVGRMARPGSSIDWNGFPDFPEARIDYKTWSTHNWSFAVDWQY